MPENTSTSNNTDLRHHPIVIILHWFTVTIVLAIVSIILIREDIDGRAIKQLLLDWHRSLGFLVLAVMLTRLALRFTLRAGNIDHQLPFLLNYLSKAGHAIIYILLITIPLLGWAQSSARGQTVHLFGVVSIRSFPFIERNRDLAETLATWHEVIAWLMLATVFFHAAAALWHHFIRRDAVLLSMLSLSRD